MTYKDKGSYESSPPYRESSPVINFAHYCASTEEPSSDEELIHQSTSSLGIRLQLLQSSVTNISMANKIDLTSNDSKLHDSWWKDVLLRVDLSLLKKETNTIYLRNVKPIFQPFFWTSTKNISGYVKPIFPPFSEVVQKTCQDQCWYLLWCSNLQKAYIYIYVGCYSHEVYIYTYIYNVRTCFGAVIYRRARGHCKSSRRSVRR